MPYWGSYAPLPKIMLDTCSAASDCIERRAIAMRLARHGWIVYASARRPETIEDLASSGCHLFTLDVCDGRPLP